MNKGFNKAGQAGFTLIELIVVIVILGILAATALPKFTGLSGDARRASLQAARGALSATAEASDGFKADKAKKPWLGRPTYLVVLDSALKAGANVNEAKNRAFDVRLTRAIGRPCRPGAAPPRCIAMLARQVALDQRCTFGLSRAGFHLREATRRRLAHEVCLGAEMLVETAVSEAGRGHQISHAHAVVTPLAKQGGGGFNDVRTVGLRLCLADLHVDACEVKTDGKYTLMSTDIKMLDGLDFDHHHKFVAAQCCHLAVRNLLR